MIAKTVELGTCFYCDAQAISVVEDARSDFRRETCAADRQRAVDEAVAARHSSGGSGGTKSIGG